MDTTAASGRFFGVPVLGEVGSLRGAKPGLGLNLTVMSEKGSRELKKGTDKDITLDSSDENSAEERLAAALRRRTAPGSPRRTSARDTSAPAAPTAAQKKRKKSKQKLKVAAAAASASSSSSSSSKQQTQATKEKQARKQLPAQRKESGRARRSTSRKDADRDYWDASSSDDSDAGSACDDDQGDDDGDEAAADDTSGNAAVEQDSDDDDDPSDTGDRDSDSDDSSSDSESSDSDSDSDSSEYAPAPKPASRRKPHKVRRVAQIDASLYRPRSEPDATVFDFDKLDLTEAIFPVIYAWLKTHFRGTAYEFIQARSIWQRPSWRLAATQLSHIFDSATATKSLGDLRQHHFLELLLRRILGYVYADKHNDAGWIKILALDPLDSTVMLPAAFNRAVMKTASKRARDLDVEERVAKKRRTGRSRSRRRTGGGGNNNDKPAAHAKSRGGGKGRRGRGAKSADHSL